MCVVKIDCHFWIFNLRRLLHLRKLFQFFLDQNSYTHYLYFDGRQIYVFKNVFDHFQ